MLPVPHPSLAMELRSAALPPPAVTEQDLDSRLRKVVSDLATVGWSIAPLFLELEDVAALLAESRELFEKGAFHRARVGRRHGLRIRDEVRNDHVMWLEEPSLSPRQKSYFGILEKLRLLLNESLYLGLFDLEAHLTFYPPGAFYRRHLDQFHGARERVVSALLYLNDAWTQGDGGALRLYTERGSEEGPTLDVLPEAGTFVAFLSSDFYHEVLPARRERASITGWLRTRSGG